MLALLGASRCNGHFSMMIGALMTECCGNAGIAPLAQIAAPI